MRSDFHLPSRCLLSLSPPNGTQIYVGSSFLCRSLQLPSPSQTPSLTMKTPDESGSLPIVVSPPPQPPQHTQQKRKRILHGEMSISIHVEMTKAHLLSDDDLKMMEDGIQGIFKKARKEISELTQTKPWNTAHEQGCHISLYAKPVEVQARLDKNPH